MPLPPQIKPNEEERIHALLALTGNSCPVIGSCLDAETLAALVDNTITNAREKEDLLCHITSCPECYEIWLSTAAEAHGKEKETSSTDTQKASPKTRFFSGVLHSIRQQKAHTAAFTVAACLLLFFGSRFITPPGSSPVSGIIENKTLSSQANKILESKAKHLPAEPKKALAKKQQQLKKSKTRAIEKENKRAISKYSLYAPHKDAELYQNIQPTLSNVTSPDTQKQLLQSWLVEITQDCHTGKKSTSLNKQQIVRLQSFLAEYLQGSSQLDKEIFQLLTHLQKTLSTKQNVIQCTELKKITDSIEELLSH